tara:strand:- start:197 stop:370 length:174 start_codon:yes stop_codon:yes gene_type:complete
MRKYENTHACSGSHSVGAGGIVPYIPLVNKTMEFNRNSQKAFKDVSKIIKNIQKNLK